MMILAVRAVHFINCFILKCPHVFRLSYIGVPLIVSECCRRDVPMIASGCAFLFLTPW
jgi:hypothetical protein